MSITLDTFTYDGTKWPEDPQEMKGDTLVLYDVGCRQTERYHHKYDRHLVLDVPGQHASLKVGERVAVHDGKVVLVLPPEAPKPKPKPKPAPAKKAAKKAR